MDYGPQLVYPFRSRPAAANACAAGYTILPTSHSCASRPCGFLRSDRELRGVPMSRAASWRTATLACTCTCAATPRCSVWPGEPVRWRRLRRAGRPARAGSCGPRPRSHAVSKRQNRALSHDGARHVALRTDPITSSTDDTLELQAGSAVVENAALARGSRYRRSVADPLTRAQGAQFLHLGPHLRDMSVDQRVHLAAAQLWPIP